ncbi:MAG: tryptophan synthase subunit alpha [Thermoplasmatota archaeon]
MIDKSLVTFITAGDPTKEATLEFLYFMDEHADLIELGIPTRDPMADGPTIQKANERALKNGININDILGIVEVFKEQSDTPIILMTYYNSIFVKGVDNFLSKADEVGVDGIIVVDLPICEAGGYLQKIKHYSTKPIFLVAPNTSKKNLKKIDEISSFVYLVSTYGVTGARQGVSQITIKALERTKRICSKPVAVGFGISKPEHIKTVINHGADGVVVGSAIVKLIEEHKENSAEIIEEKVKELKIPLL